ncbi:MAG: sulfotransferase [Leptospirales bacterium]
MKLYKYYNLFSRWSFSKKVFNFLIRRTFFQKVIGLFSKPVEPEKWVFILGCYNSGSTLLSQILGAHDSMSSLPIEGVFLTEQLPSPEDYGWPRMWIKCSDKVGLSGFSEEQLAQKARKVKKQWSSWFNPSKKIYVEKSIANAARIGFFNKQFSSAYFIHIVRNGYAVSRGIQKKANPAKWGNREFGDSYPLDMCARQWAETDETIRKAKPELNHYLQISYEDLSDRSMETLNKITKFLGVGPFDKSVLEVEWNFGSVTSKLKNMNFLVLDKISPEEKREVRKEGKEILKKYGYEKK